ncbi:MAG: UbiA family prenyltransferase [Leptolyngbyaceae cyanobacterium SM1_1_3]|nr:UbiA family prenyltransferase [Leptolyngbyaceae cyanobacterium SM1_1_3]NJN04233.1 UbiA family prenyltransferase [Leptolyngbyaceae cyanobacterium RM1_1_2]NJO10501.1 UbiA family prenyltransferase [Leptolyngbyaceae cyanobacterium SL_1_1]
MNLSLWRDRFSRRSLYTVFLNLFIYANVWVAGAIASLVFFVQRTLELGYFLSPVLLIFVAALIPYNLDRVIDTYVQEIPDQKAQAFFRQSGVAVILGLLSLSLAVLIYRAPTAVQWVCLGGLVPLIYGIPLWPWHHQSGWRWYRLKDIPGAKAWIVAGTITYAVVAVPLAYAGQGLNLTSGIMSLFLLVFVGSNSHVFDIRDIESDRQQGVLTMPVLWGVSNTRLFWTAANLFMLFILIGGRWQHLQFPALVVTVPSLLLTLTYLWQVNPCTRRNTYHIWVDGTLFLPALLSLAVR